MLAGEDSSSSAAETPAERGLRLLLTRPFMGSDLTEEDFDLLWTVWPEPLRSDAEAASPEERRRMAFSRYGFVESPGREGGPPLGYVDAGGGRWTMNCLSCHGGKVAGQVVPGLGNSHFAFQTLAQDAVKLLVSRGHQLTAEELSQLALPLGRSNGTTNAQIFSVALVALRDADLNFVPDRPLPRFEHHDLDAPPLWNVAKKQRLYIDGFVGKSHRVIMQFALVPSNDGETLRGWEDDFRDVLAWIESLQPPKYPWAIDQELAARGEKLFNRTCAGCHGTYGPDGRYPEEMVDIGVVGTDDARLVGMPVEHRRFFAESWFNDGDLEVIEEPLGYVAPPLDGIWASAPYLHNGSVPTLWHLFRRDKRPIVWLRSEDGYDQQRVGLEVVELDDLPPDARRGDEKRRYFDTRLPGKSAAGHYFPEDLTEDEKRAVIEYLKTL